jgi:hypothetical protein
MYCVQYVSFIVFVMLCAVFCLSAVCNFVCCVLFECGVLFCVLCVIVVPLPPGTNPFAVKINNNNNNNNNILSAMNLVRTTNPKTLIHTNCLVNYKCF